MITEFAPNDFLRAMAWFSPAFPIGAFSYSHGLEWAVEAGDITHLDSARDWIGDVIAFGSGRNDCVLLAHAYRAEVAGDGAELFQIAEFAAAFQPGKERAFESQAQGKAFLLAIEAAWPPPRPLHLMTAWHGPLAYPVMVGAVAAAHRLALFPTLLAYLQAFTGNLISAAIRLSMLGQTDGQRVMAALLIEIERIARQALMTPLDGLGGACVRSDMASLAHETQYTRLFRS